MVIRSKPTMNNATQLAQQQSSFLASIFAIKNIADKAINTPATNINALELRGVQVYQANASYAAKRSLQSAYPVIAQLVGDDAFAHLARDYWAQHPPMRGDLAQWGGELAIFIDGISALQTEPYLSDVARAEWALHVAATAADQNVDLATFSLLTEHDPDAVSLKLASATALISSIHPVASILTAHLYEQPTFEAVGQMIRSATPETALVWRRGLQPRVMACTATESAFVARLLAGQSLLSALEDANMHDEAAFDFHQWLQKAVELGLVAGAQLLH